MTQEAITYLRPAQNGDGGWGFRAGMDSWTEPTALALLALSGEAEAEDARRRGTEWLLRSQRRDGAWGPHRAVDMSTWVTAPVLCVLSEDPSTQAYRNGLAWILRGRGEEAGPGGVAGWPWSPHTTGWVLPTCFSLFALHTAPPSEGVRSRLEQGRRFLLACTCSGGGWNYGAPHTLGYDAGAYPETTGAALAALQGMDAPAVAGALDCAERLFRQCRSTQSAAWLRMGLAAHGRTAPPALHTMRRNVLDFALSALADRMENGIPAFGVSHART